MASPSAPGSVTDRLISLARQVSSLCVKVDKIEEDIREIKDIMDRDRTAARKYWKPWIMRFETAEQVTKEYKRDKRLLFLISCGVVALITEQLMDYFF